MSTQRHIISIKGHALHNRIKVVAESHPTYEPTWFDTLTFYPSSPVKDDRDWAVATFQRFCVAVAQKINSHIIPIACIGKTKKGAYHIHYCLLTERGRRQPKYRELKKAWWAGRKRGRSEPKRYDSEMGGIPYTLRHPHYIPIHTPFCPRRKKCQPACVKAYHHDIVRTALELNEKESPLLAFGKASSAQIKSLPPCIKERFKPQQTQEIE
jgi:hypothetical protein